MTYAIKVWDINKGPAIVYTEAAMLMKKKQTAVRDHMNAMLTKARLMNKSKSNNTKPRTLKLQIANYETEKELFLGAMNDMRMFTETVRTTLINFMDYLVSSVRLVSWEHGIKPYDILSQYLNYATRLTGTRAAYIKVASTEFEDVYTQLKNISGPVEAVEVFMDFLKEYDLVMDSWLGIMSDQVNKWFPVEYKKILNQLVRHGTAEELRITRHILVAEIQINEQGGGFISAEKDTTVQAKMLVAQLKTKRVQRDVIEKVMKDLVSARYKIRNVLVANRTLQQKLLLGIEVRQEVGFVLDSTMCLDAWRSTQEVTCFVLSEDWQNRPTIFKSLFSEVAIKHEADKEAFKIRVTPENEIVALRIIDPSPISLLPSTTTTTTKSSNINIITSLSSVLVIPAAAEEKTIEGSLRSLKIFADTMWRGLKPERQRNRWMRRKGNYWSQRQAMMASAVTDLIRIKSILNTSETINSERRAFDVMVEALMRHRMFDTTKARIVETFLILMHWPIHVQNMLFNSDLFNDVSSWWDSVVKVDYGKYGDVVVKLLVYFRLLGEVMLNTNGHYSPWAVIQDIQWKLSPLAPTTQKKYALIAKKKAAEEEEEEEEEEKN